MAVETRTIWHYEPPHRYGEKGAWTKEDVSVTVPDHKPHDSTAGDIWTWVLAIAALVIIFWVTSSWIGDSPSGRCQQELGYMGQSEVGECEEYDGR